MPGTTDWLDAARGDDWDDLREKILTGYKAGKPFTPYEPTIPVPGLTGRVLDFGCGLGRNFPLLTRRARGVVGFDLPAMIERCRTVTHGPELQLSDDWDRTREEPFDLIYASLVLQHVATDTCLGYLRDFAVMAPVLYLLTRVTTDFQANLLDLVERAGAFDAPECVLVEHDDSTHQLRVLGRVPFTEAARAQGHEHYELLLRRRA